MSYLPNVVFKDRWAVISGTRHPHPDDVPVIKAVMEELLLSRGGVAEGPAGIVFGGAAGVDTAALRFAFATRGNWTFPKLVVVVPGTVAQQPAACARAIRECADEVIELGKPITAQSLNDRNGVMLLTATTRSKDGDAFLVAFPVEGRWRGGTHNTINRAQTIGMPVYRIALQGSAEAHRP